jgi:hypothetical protein
MADTLLERSKLEAIIQNGSLYEAIGVRFDASNDDIQRAGKRMQRENHPDKHMSLPPEEREVKEDLFNQATIARKVLGEQRDNYNAFIVARHLMPDSVLTTVSVNRLERMLQKVDYKSLALQFINQGTRVKPKTNTNKYRSIINVGVQFYGYLNPKLTKYFSDIKFNEYKKEINETVEQYVNSVVRDSSEKVPSDMVRRIKNAYIQKLRKGLASKVKKSVAQQVKELKPVFISYAVYDACQKSDMEYDKVISWAKQQGHSYIIKLSRQDFEKITPVLNAIK